MKTVRSIQNKPEDSQATVEVNSTTETVEQPETQGIHPKIKINIKPAVTETVEEKGEENLEQVNVTQEPTETIAVESVTPVATVEVNSTTETPVKTGVVVLEENKIKVKEIIPVKRLTEKPVLVVDEKKKSATKNDFINLFKENIQYAYSEVEDGSKGEFLAAVTKKDAENIYGVFIDTLQEIILKNKLDYSLFSLKNWDGVNKEFKLKVAEVPDKIHINPKNIAAREGYLKRASYKVSTSFGFDGGETIKGYLPEGVEAKDADHIVMEDGTIVKLNTK